MIDNTDDLYVKLCIYQRNKKNKTRSDRLRRDITLATQTYVAIRHLRFSRFFGKSLIWGIIRGIWFFVCELKPRTNAVLCNCQNLLKYFLSLTLSARFYRSKKTAVLIDTSYTKFARYKTGYFILKKISIVVNLYANNSNNSKVMWY